MDWPPQLDWPSYAAKEGVQDPELAALLLSLVDPLADMTRPDQEDRVGAFAAAGFDALTVAHWIRTEEVQAFNRHLNHAGAQLRHICPDGHIASHHLLSARRIFRKF